MKTNEVYDVDGYKDFIPVTIDGVCKIGVCVTVSAEKRDYKLVVDEVYRFPKVQEPQKVMVPKFVAEWIEYCKANGIKLLGALDPDAKPWEFGMEMLVNSFDGNVGDCRTWATRNQDTFARAWLDGYGYEIKKEQLYTVEIPNPNINTHTILQKVGNGLVLITVTNARWRGWAESKLTESEIKQDFEWAFQFAKPVEENNGK